jgi:hypothetical protein
MRSYKSHFKPCFNYIGEEFQKAEQSGKYVIDRLIMGKNDFEKLRQVDLNHTVGECMDVDNDGAWLWGAKISTLGVCGLIVYMGKHVDDKSAGKSVIIDDEMVLK